MSDWIGWYYNVYLRSEEWHARRALVLQRESGMCQGCRNALATHVHHRAEAYRQLRKTGRELLCDLVALCDSCHMDVAHHEKRQCEDRPNPISLTCHGGPAEEPERLARLNRVLEFVAGFHLKAMPVRLHDHKGELTVTWLAAPSVAAAVAFKTAWEIENEPRDLVTHVLVGEPETPVLPVFDEAADA